MKLSNLHLSFLCFSVQRSLLCIYTDEVLVSKVNAPDSQQVASSHTSVQMD